MIDDQGVERLSVSLASHNSKKLVVKGNRARSEHSSPLESRKESQNKNGGRKVGGGARKNYMWPGHSGSSGYDIFGVGHTIWRTWGTTTWLGSDRSVPAGLRTQQLAQSPQLLSRCPLSESLVPRGHNLVVRLLQALPNLNAIPAAWMMWEKGVRNRALEGSGSGSIVPAPLSSTDPPGRKHGQ